MPVMTRKPVRPGSARRRSSDCSPARREFRASARRRSSERRLFARRMTQAACADSVRSPSRRCARISAQRSLRDHFAAVHARAGAEIDDVIRAPHRLLIVLDDDERISLLAQRVSVSSSAGCRADAGRWSAHRARKARRADSSRAAPPAGCAAIRRRSSVFAERPSAR